MKRLFLVLSLFLGVLDCTASQAGSGRDLDLQRGKKIEYTVVLADDTKETVDDNFIKQFEVLNHMVEDLGDDAQEQPLPLPMLTKEEFIPLYLLATMKTSNEFLRVIKHFPLQEQVNLYIIANHLGLLPYDDGISSFDRQQLIVQAITRKLRMLDPEKLTKEEKETLETIDSHQVLHDALVNTFYMAPFIKTGTIGNQSYLTVGTYSPDGKYFAAIKDSSKTLGLFDTQTEKEIKTIRNDNVLYKLIFKRDDHNDLRLYGLFDSGIYKFKPDSLMHVGTTSFLDEDGSLLHFNEDGSPLQYYQVEFNPVFNQIVLEVKIENNQDEEDDNDEETFINSYSINNGQQLFSITIDEKEELYSFKHSPDGMQLAALFGNVDSLEDTTLRIFNAHTGELQKTIKRNNISRILGYSPDSKHIVITTFDKELIVLDSTTNKIILKIENAFRNRINGFFYSPDGNFITISDEDEPAPDTIIKTWNSRSGRLVTYQPIDKIFNSFYHNSDGTQLAAIDTQQNGNITLFERPFGPESLSQAYGKKMIDILRDLKKLQ